MTAFIGNTNVLELIGLQNALDDTYINDATVTVTVKDAGGEEVEGETWPLAMAYVTASDGNYRAILSHELEFAPRERRYYAHIEVNGGADQIGHWEFLFTPLTRTGANED